ncbi:DNA polymerase IV [Thalassospira sp.]|uniref:DNA polymerase IV n=1 Tax=Thalassospira sp. TaxID=1912094 RepID=UPI0027366C09|nr:DNA polymerase IV [Thalassospira sp.]MDP2698238.1 DNA polymerase IV [Thalassospira sp.]
MLYALCPTCHHKWRAPPGKDAAAKFPACPHCGATDVLAHAELPDLTIGHLDCDAFYASIEKRDRPELADMPVIIGGGHRGVVSTCCYVARKYGVRSAMPAFKARALCPDGVFLPPDMAKYQREGLKIRDMMRALTPIIEPLSIDEAFLDLTDCSERLGQSPAECLATLQARIRAEIGITVSIGLSYNKFLAKIASDLNKPFGFSMIGRAEAPGFLAPKPVRMMWGVGAAMERKLHQDAITTIGQLQEMDIHTLQGRYGTIGKRFYYFSRGEDNRRVEPHSERKSLSAETTFDTDVATLPELAAILTNMAARVARDLARKNIAGHTVVLKLKTADFKTRTRNMRLTYPSLRQDVITESAMTLLKKEIDGTKYRLLGVGVSELSTADEADPHDLFAADEDIQGEISAAEISHSSPVKLPRPTMEQLRESLTRPYRLRLRQPRQHHFEF